MPSLAGTLRLADFGPEIVAQLPRGAHGSALDNSLSDARTRDTRDAYAAAGGVPAGIAVPLVKGGRFVAAFYVHQTEPRRWTPGDEWLLREVAERTWAAVERARAEAAVRASEAQFRTVTQVVPSMVWSAAPDGTITYANEQWFRYCGLEPEVNATDWPKAVLHPDDRERCVAAWRQALATGEDYEIEVRNRRHDGVYRWFLTRARALRDARGEIVAWFGATTDIHDRKAAETALRESEARLRDVVDGATGYAMITLDAERRITGWNPGAERLMGYAEAEVLGQSGDMVFTAEDRDAGQPEREFRSPAKRAAPRTSAGTSARTAAASGARG